VTRDRLLSVRGGLMAVAAAALVAGLVLALTSGGGQPGAVQPAPATTSTSPSLAAQGLSRQTPDTVTPTGSPAQEQVDQNLAQGQLADLSQLEAVKVPQPAISGGWPRLPAATAPESWAQTFVEALLDIRYSQQSRIALGSWLQAQEAPYLLPAVPVSVADKILFLSLLDPHLVQSAASPIVSSSRWETDAKAGVHQTVSGLLMQPDPGWQQLVASGWQPTDARMDILDVSGLLTVTSGSHNRVEHFTLSLSIGSARWHPGYGTISIDEWRVTG
jgi:hypothetical protein